MIKLGQKVKDKISGYRGIAASRCEWLFGCVRVGVISETIKKDGEPVSVTFDEDSLEVTESKERIKPATKFTGGDRSYNSERKDITR